MNVISFYILLILLLILLLAQGQQETGSNKKRKLDDGLHVLSPKLKRVVVDLTSSPGFQTPVLSSSSSSGVSTRSSTDETTAFYMFDYNM